jgi:hypothetical protein
MKLEFDRFGQCSVNGFDFDREVVEDVEYLKAYLKAYMIYSGYTDLNVMITGENVNLNINKCVLEKTSL